MNIDDVLRLISEAVARGDIDPGNEQQLIGWVTGMDEGQFQSLVQLIQAAGPNAPIGGLINVIVHPELWDQLVEGGLGEDDGTPTIEEILAEMFPDGIPIGGGDAFAALQATLLGLLGSEGKNRAEIGLGLINNLFDLERAARQSPLGLVDRLALASQVGTALPFSQATQEELQQFSTKPVGGLLDRLLAILEEYASGANVPPPESEPDEPGVDPSHDPNDPFAAQWKIFREQGVQGILREIQRISDKMQLVNEMLFSGQIGYDQYLQEREAILAVMEPWLAFTEQQSGTRPELDRIFDLITQNEDIPEQPNQAEFITSNQPPGPNILPDPDIADIERREHPVVRGGPPGVALGTGLGAADFLSGTGTGSLRIPAFFGHGGSLRVGAGAGGPVTINDAQGRTVGVAGEQGQESIQFTPQPQHSIPEPPPGGLPLPIPFDTPEGIEAPHPGPTPDGRPVGEFPEGPFPIDQLHVEPEGDEAPPPGETPDGRPIPELPATTILTETEKFRYDWIAENFPELTHEQMLALSVNPAELDRYMNVETTGRMTASRLLASVMQNDVRYNRDLLQDLSLSNILSPARATARDFNPRLNSPDVVGSLQSIIGSDPSNLAQWMFELGAFTPSGFGSARGRTTGSIGGLR